MGGIGHYTGRLKFLCIRQDGVEGEEFLRYGILLLMPYTPRVVII